MVRLWATSPATPVAVSPARVQWQRPSRMSFFWPMVLKKALSGESFQRFGDFAGALIPLQVSGSGNSLASLRRFWAVCSEEEFVVGAAGSSQSQPVEVDNTSEVSEQHLDLFPLSSGHDVGVGLGDLAGPCHGHLRRYFAAPCTRGIRAASRLQHAGSAVERGSPMHQGGIVVDHRAARRQQLPGRAGVGITVVVVGKVGA